MVEHRPRRLLTLAIQRFDRTNALHTRAVTLDEVLVLHAPPLVCATGLLNGTFDVAEMPLAYYLFLRGQGAPLVAVPVFTDRIFLQQYVYTRPDTGITSLADLRGRRVAVPRYFMTAGLWYRTILHEQFGIAPREIQWVATCPELDPAMRIPPGVQVTVSPGPYLGLEKLLDGTADCLLTEATPVVPENHRSHVVRVYPDPHAAQTAYFRETAFHPIVHLVVMRQSLVQERPEICLELCQAFDHAKLSAYRLLQNERVTSLPLMRSYLDETLTLFGEDPWPYGLTGRNRAELEHVLDLAYLQALTPRRLSLDDLFDASVRQFPFQAKMLNGANLGNAATLVGDVGTASVSAHTSDTPTTTSPSTTSTAGT